VSNAWVEYWMDIAVDAGLTGRSSLNGWIRWLQWVDNGVVVGATGSRGSTVVAVLQRHGITANISLQTDVRDALEAFDMGNELDQSTSLNAITKAVSC